MTQVSRLISSIPANNQKIIEIYQKLQAGRLETQPEFQRKKVWRKQHKIDFIDTILRNYPFPEVYIAPRQVNVELLELNEIVVDGQQRLTAIQDYINGQDVFALKTKLTPFKDLDVPKKQDFLNYEVSVRYLKNATEDQVKEIFQRINRTDYSLNRMEIFHAVWGDSELVGLAKQMTEEDLEVHLEVMNFVIPPVEREWLVQFWVTGIDEGNGVFSEAEVSRMLSLQYVLVLLVTMIKGEYFHRNSYIEAAVKAYNEGIPDAPELVSRLVETTRLISSLGLQKGSFWLHQSSLLTMIVELAKIDHEKLDASAFAAELRRLEEFEKSGLASADDAVSQYRQLTREGVNAKAAREKRAEILNKILDGFLVS
ncbi:DUF262 domain-containing protein [Stenotrophomonas indicatrix]|uniref:DUF262 domain-containing protein n=1 Tax=Stenotrophomonas indicatrix TaxID=2045451 RepID=UPI00372F9BE0